MLDPTNQMTDLIVIIPGITGSILAKDGEEVWGLSGATIIKNLLSLGRNLKNLQLPQDIGNEFPHDGVKPIGLMPDLHLLPGLWTIDGYGKLVHNLRKRFQLTFATESHAGNLLLFPYDWRLSNVVSARQLAHVATRELERWQTLSNNPDAKLILICHSMGGLVARWFLELEGGREITRRLITIGTPFQGSINALSTLVNGFSKGLGPLRVDLTDLVRSFPSMYQLLPTYPSIVSDSGPEHKLIDLPIPEIAHDLLKSADEFHQRISSSSPDAEYRVSVIKGHIQPTNQSAKLCGNSVEPLRQYKGVDLGGDGTVPRFSSHPSDWRDGDSDSIFAAQKHGSLQNTDGVLDQIFGILTGENIARWMGAKRISVDVPEVIASQEKILIQAQAEDDDDTLPLEVNIENEQGEICRPPELLKNLGQGQYEANVDGLPPGAYRVRVSSAVSSRPVDPVTDLILVWGLPPINE